MALYLCKNADGTGKVDDISNPILTKHTSNGDSQTIELYVYNDGKRKGVQEDAGTVPIMYSNFRLSLEGVSHILQQEVQPSESAVVFEFESVVDWGVGTIITSSGERCRIDAILSPTTIQVKRNYKEDNLGSSIISGHNTNAVFVAETKTVSLALPNPNNYGEAGNFLAGGAPLTAGVDPTLLTESVDARDTSTLIRSTNGQRYHVGGLIKIDNEIMRINSISGNELTVTRGYDNTTRASHQQNATIYAVGLVDFLVGEDNTKTHKIYLKNSPPKFIYA